MTDYNNGEWHGWNGGECPVHPRTVVRAATSTGSKSPARAGHVNWESEDLVIAFQVTKEYKEPREFWLVLDGARKIELHKARPEIAWGEVIHVREVEE